MNNRILFLGLLANSLLLLTSRTAKADIDGDHLGWGALQQGLVSGSAVEACSSEFPSSTQAAVNRWNAAIGHTVFSYGCTSPDVSVTKPTQAEFNLKCGAGNHACTGLAFSGDSIVNPTTVYLNPGELSAFPGLYHSDGSSHTSRDITHEFGHVLGHADYSGCPPGTPTVMDWTEGCWWETPQPLDGSNYNDAYRPNGVTSLTGSSPGVGQAQLSWNPNNIHAEAMFRVNRWPGGVGCCGTEAGSAAKNASGITLSSQPYGSQTYGVWGWTYALYNGYGYNPSPGYVTVIVPGPNLDSDGDGFNDWVEVYLGTDAYDKCPDNSSDDAWPLDINKDRYATMADVNKFSGHYGATRDDPTWWQRLDFNADGVINMADVNKYHGMLGKHCT